MPSSFGSQVGKLQDVIYTVFQSFQSETSQSSPCLVILSLSDSFFLFFHSSILLTVLPRIISQTNPCCTGPQPKAKNPLTEPHFPHQQLSHTLEVLLLQNPSPLYLIGRRERKSGLDVLTIHYVGGFKSFISFISYFNAMMQYFSFTDRETEARRLSVLTKVMQLLDGKGRT